MPTKKPEPEVKKPFFLEDAHRVNQMGPELSNTMRQLLREYGLPGPSAALAERLDTIKKLRPVWFYRAIRHFYLLLKAREECKRVRLFIRPEQMSDKAKWTEPGRVDEFFTGFNTSWPILPADTWFVQLCTGVTSPTVRSRYWVPVLVIEKLEVVE